MENTAHIAVIGSANEGLKAAIDEVLRQYDSNAVQVVYVDVVDDGEKLTVEHKFASHSDEHFFQFDEKRETLLRTDDAQKDLRVKNKSAAAYLWFWNLFCTEVSGYGDPNEDMPENWRELVPEEDKISAVDGLFSAQIVRKPKTENKKFVSWQRNQGADYLVKVVFDGEVLEVAHKLKPKTAEHSSAWQDISGEVSFKQGELLEGNNEMKIPATAREKVKFYEKLDGGAEGYKGRVPAFIKLLLMNDYFARSSQTAKKPKTSAEPSKSESPSGTAHDQAA